jgi:hypothetical protein
MNKKLPVKQAAKDISPEHKIEKKLFWKQGIILLIILILLLIRQFFMP